MVFEASCRGEASSKGYRALGQVRLPCGPMVAGRWAGIWSRMSWARRVLRFSILRIVVAAVPIVAFTGGVSWLGARLGHPGVLAMLIAGAGAVALYVVYVGWIEQRPVRELEGTGAIPELARGFALGVALFAATIGVLWLAGACTVERGDGWGTAAGGL